MRLKIKKRDLAEVIQDAVDELENHVHSSYCDTWGDGTKKLILELKECIVELNQIKDLVDEAIYTDRLSFQGIRHNRVGWVSEFSHDNTKKEGDER